MRYRLVLSSLFILQACAANPSALRAPASSEPISCKKVLEHEGSTRSDCVVHSSQGDKTIHVVTLKGDAAKASYDQGFLLASEIESGLLKGSIAISEANLQGGMIKSFALNKLYSCYFDRLKRSLSPDQSAVIEAIYAGIVERKRAEHENFAYSVDDTYKAILAIDLAMIANVLQRTFAESPAVLTEVIKDCAIPASTENLAEEIEQTWGQHVKLGGCLGIAVPPRTAQDNLIHGRDLDLDLVGYWNLSPTLYLVAEPGKYKFASVGAAGLAFPGAVGGTNEKGLTVSAHEMATTKFNSAFDTPRGTLAVRLTQKILEEASSVEEAYEIVKKSSNFTAWAIFVSDAKTNEVASIEFSGERVELARHTRNAPMVQTNHFLSPTMQDQGFTYDFNKYLESVSRLFVANRNLAKLHSGEHVGLAWMIDQLANHEEASADKEFPYEAARRAFGRTAVKSENAAGIIAIPKLKQIWFTDGAKNPAVQGNYTGFELNWDTLGFRTLGTERTTQFDNIPNWEESLETYVSARQAFMPYLGNDPETAIGLLDKAIAQAQKDGIEELPYYFARARVEQVLAQKSEGARQEELLKASLADWEFLWSMRSELHPYGQALVALYWSMVQDLSFSTDNKILMALYIANPAISRTRAERSRFAVNTLQALYDRYGHFDLKIKLNLAQKALFPKAKWKFPNPDLVVVEQ